MGGETMRRVVVAAPVALALMLGTVACSPDRTTGLDGPVYTSVADLGEDADVVAVGEFIELSRTVDEADLYEEGDGGFIEGDRGMELDLWSFRVNEVLQGDAELAGQVIEITQMSPRSTEDAIYSAEEGRPAVMFLLAYDNGETYGVVGIGAGSLEIRGDELVAPEGVDPALRQDVDALGGLSSLEESLR